MNTLKKLTTLGVVTLVGVILFLYPKPLRKLIKMYKFMKMGIKLAKLILN